MVPNDAATAGNSQEATVAVEPFNAETMVKMTKTTYGFKKDKTSGIKRPSVDLELPFPTAAGLVHIITVGGKELELLLDTAADVVYNAARSQVAENEKINQETLKLDPLFWTAIAHQPKGERKGSSITAEQWEEFSKDYLEVMSPISGKTAEQLSNQVQLFVRKLLPAKSNKKILGILEGMLAMWYTSSANKEDFVTIYEFLSERLASFLKSDDQALLDNI